MSASQCSSTATYRSWFFVLAGALMLLLVAVQQPSSVRADDPPESELSSDVAAQTDEAAAVESSTEASEAVASVEPVPEPPCVYSSYFDAYEAAQNAKKNLLVYCFDQQAPAEAQVEFETQTLADAETNEALNKRFLLVKIGTDTPVQTASTVTRTSYVRSGFRRVRKTWNQVVKRDLFDGKTSRPGLLVVQVTDAGATSAPTIIAHFPFQTPQLSPHVFAVDTDFKPWKRDVFCSLVSTPVTTAQVYLDEFCSRQSLDSSCVQREFSGQVTSLNHVYYDYGYTGENLHPDRITTRLHIAQNEQLALFDEPVAMRIDVYSLRDSAVPVHYAYARVLPGEEWQTVTVEGLQPETPYRMSAYFYTPGKSPQLIGEANSPFYAVTSGTEKVAQARAAIASKALGEVNDWRRGRYDRRKGYVVGRWCERFYCWNIFQHVHTPYRDGYSPIIFSRHGALFSGRTMRNMIQNNNVMGDHIRTSNHGFMVLSYDKHLGQVWTIEGNYNNSVVLTRRNLSDYWSLGTIVDSMLIEQDQDG